MKEVSAFRRIYPLTLPFRLLLIALGILFVLAPIYIPLSEVSAFKDWRVYVFFVVVGGILLYYGLTTFLIISTEGIKSYFFFPFHFNFSWKSLEYLYLENSGIVYLFWNTDDKQWLQKILGGRMQLSLFVDDWMNSELITKVRTQAPQLEIAEKILLRPNHAIWQYSGAMMFYYMICIFSCIPLAFIANLYILEPVRVTLGSAFLGFMGGTLGGMIALGAYSEALKKRRNKKLENEIRRLGMWNYVLPFSGLTIGFILGLLAQTLLIGWQSHGFLNLIVLFVTTNVQLVALPYMTYNRTKQNVFS